jgi:hypothetical protein
MEKLLHFRTLKWSGWHALITDRYIEARDRNHTQFACILVFTDVNRCSIPDCPNIFI